jgi:hypothetical protein
LELKAKKNTPETYVPRHPSLDKEETKYPRAPYAPAKMHEPEHRHEPGCERGEEERVSKIVERTWFFGGERECEEHRGHDCDCFRDPCCEPDPHCPPHHGGGRPGRPTRPPGRSTGRIDQGGPLNNGDINNPNPPGVWVGPRAELDLPYLFMRSNAGDLGKRPVVGAPFWESPDIFILAGVPPALAPPLPPALGQTALAGQPNTLYAHVWNFGNAAANEVIVEFYWMDPSLGVSEIHLISQTFMCLGAKGSGKSHAVVKCPVEWTPTFVNGGHECLLVRVWDNPSDLPGEPKFDASVNRHVAQRNIHVVAPGAAAAHFLKVGGPIAPALAPAAALTQPLTLKVGPLYGSPAEVSVERIAPASMPWLQLHTGARGVFPAMATPAGAPSLSAPTTTGGGYPVVPGAATQKVQGDGQNVALSTSDNAPGPGEAHVYRVSATQNGAVFGGYTVVILG